MDLTWIIIIIVAVVVLLALGFWLGAATAAVEFRRQLDRGFIEIGDEVYSVTKKRMGRR